MKYTFLILLMISFFACTNEKKIKDNKSDTTAELNIIPFNNIEESIKQDTAIMFVENNGNQKEEITLQNDSSGYIFADFISASIVEAEIGLHFIEEETGKEINFYYFDIDPEKEGLFTYQEIEGAIFPELVTNPEIKGQTLKIFWKIENRHIDLADEDADVKVIKKIERMD